MIIGLYDDQECDDIIIERKPWESVKSGPSGEIAISSRYAIFYRKGSLDEIDANDSFGVKDSDTIASQLQAYFNNHYGDVIVENHGSHGMNLLLAVNNLVQTEIKPGDIVVFFDFIEFSDLNNTSIESIDLNEIDRGNKFFLDLDKVNCHFSPSYEKESKSQN